MSERVQKTEVTDTEDSAAETVSSREVDDDCSGERQNIATSVAVPQQVRLATSHILYTPSRQYVYSVHFCRAMLWISAALILLGLGLCLPSASVSSV